MTPILTDFAAVFATVSADEQRAALDRAKRPGNGCFRQYGERPTPSDSQRIIANHARMGIKG